MSPITKDNTLNEISHQVTALSAQEMPKVSVVVPIYKMEACMRRCIDSLLAQTLTDIEIILVDDGSPDRSGIICDEYAMKDARVRVIHKANGGVSSARQCGLEAARGKYIIHADPDDWTEPDMLQCLLAKAEAENADMVVCDFWVHTSQEGRYWCQRPSAFDCETLLRDLFKGILHGSCCNKLVRRSCFTSRGIHFPVGCNYCEDVFVNTWLLLDAHLKVTYLDKALYHYERIANANSMVDNLTLKDFEMGKTLYAHMAEILRGSVVERLGRVAIANGILTRAFMGHFFSSQEFLRRCRPYREGCFKDGHWVSGISLWLSCMGCYGLMYRIYRWAKRKG